MSFIKSYSIDLIKIKKRFKLLKLGSELEANNSWKHLLGNNNVMKKKTLEKLKNKGIRLSDLNTLRVLIKSSI